MRERGERPGRLPLPAIGPRPAMPAVRVKVTRWLRQTLDLAPDGLEDITVPVPEGESLLGLFRRLTAAHRDVWDVVFDEGTQTISPNILVVLNGSIVNPYDRAGARLKDGDEVMLLPMFDGG